MLELYVATLIARRYGFDTSARSFLVRCTEAYLAGLRLSCIRRPLPGPACVTIGRALRALNWLDYRVHRLDWLVGNVVWAGGR